MARSSDPTGTAQTESGEGELRAVFDTVQVGILVAEAPSGRLVQINPFMDRIGGGHWPRSARIEDYASWTCFHADGTRVALHENPLARALEGEEHPVLDMLHHAADGRRHWIRVTGAAIRDQDGAITGAVATVVDVDLTRRAEESLRDLNSRLAGEAGTAASHLQSSQRAFLSAEAARALAEEQVRQLQKMEAVGQLTGGIAHDFNNMLAVVVGALDLAQRRLTQGNTEIGRFIEAAMGGAQRAARLTQRLMAFSRQKPLAPVPLDVNPMVSGMADLLRRTLGEAIELEMVLPEDLWRIHADPGQIENALLNLAVNARDAMQGYGRLLVETGNVHPGPSNAGCFVRLAVTDTGCGMSPEVIARAADPFFTTKQAGAGTGLGLSQVLDAVRQAGGYLEIQSEPERGATVQMFLPRFDGQLETTVAVARPPLRKARASEVVLVVEDDKRVREMAVMGLRELGYGVLEADCGAAALRQIDAHPDVTLLFTDIVMPGMNGHVLAAAAIRRRPGLRVLFTTGNMRDTAAVGQAQGEDGAAHDIEMIAKPYGIELLSARVRDVLDR